MSRPLKFATACAVVRRADPALAPVLRFATAFRVPRHRDLFQALVSAILAQQLSVKAADTIHRRVCALFPDETPNARGLLAIPDEALRAAGVSRQKIRYLRSAADAALREQGWATDARRMTDEDLMASLCRIDGVGRWTAEMLLMFTLGRPDVFPVDDLGIQQAMRTCYRVRASRGRAFRTRLERIADAWRPHRSLVCRALWAWRGAGCPGARSDARRARPPGSPCAGDPARVRP